MDTSLFMQDLAHRKLPDSVKKIYSTRKSATAIDSGLWSFVFLRLLGLLY